MVSQLLAPISRLLRANLRQYFVALAGGAYVRLACFPDELQVSEAEKLWNCQNLSLFRIIPQNGTSLVSPCVTPVFDCLHNLENTCAYSLCSLRVFSL